MVVKFTFFFLVIREIEKKVKKKSAICRNTVTLEDSSCDIFSWILTLCTEKKQSVALGKLQEPGLKNLGEGEDFFHYVLDTQFFPLSY